MNARQLKRESLGLTQTVAASVAGVSLATRRRWEESPDSVKPATRLACENVLDDSRGDHGELKISADKFAAAWAESTLLTPRQAWAIATTLEVWADGEIADWIRSPGTEPMHELSPFVGLDRRVLFHVADNRAWSASFRDRCYAVAAALEAGVLPFDRVSAYIDEVLMALALPFAKDQLDDMPELFDLLAPREPIELEDVYLIGDGDWDQVSDGFDDAARWLDWEVPTLVGSPLLPGLLAERHPFTWFD